MLGLCGAAGPRAGARHATIGYDPPCYSQGVIQSASVPSPSGGGGSCSSRRAALRVTRALGIYSAQRRAQ
eukprot:COSAG05_NODE_6038_length_1036_cov_2.705443_1_plen_69_part_01